MLPSEWAERERYLPASVSSLPGPYRFAIAPYLKEPLDCLSVESPVREIAVMKGVQIGATVGILENAIGYCIAHIKTAPVMMVTADAELAKLRIESNIIPMLQQSGLEELIKSSDVSNARKSGKTNKKIEWLGGGFLVPFGAQNANKLRSISIQVLLRDEIDGWPDTVGKDGDPLKLSMNRTAAYESRRKVLDLSTPLIKGDSKIDRQFRRGDQRYYEVQCLDCRQPQVLRWRHTDPDTGVVSGITWKLDEEERLSPGSVRYECRHCGYAHSNDDKPRLFAPDNAQWVPTATAMSPQYRSYHISALYSPIGMQTWEACVLHWLEAWDVSGNRCRDSGLLQTFYNLILGEPYEVRGQKLQFSAVSGHRRLDYQFGEIPNEWATQYCGGPVLLLTCTVDVHDDDLAVAIVGWTDGRRSFLIDYWRFEGDTSRIDDPGTWRRLDKLLQTRDPYIADDGKRYCLAITFIDSGHFASQVYEFAERYEVNVYPIKGRDLAPKSALLKEFWQFRTMFGTVGVGITVDLYKERWNASLNRQWDGQGLQPNGHFNCPGDTTDRQLKELTAETKQRRTDKETGKLGGLKWHRNPGTDNELWDLLVYSAAAQDFLAWDVCINQLGLEVVHWPDFYDYIAREQRFFTSPN